MKLRSPRVWLNLGLVFCMGLALLAAVLHRRPAATAKAAAPVPAPTPTPPLPRVRVATLEGTDLLSNKIALEHYSKFEFERSINAIKLGVTDEASQLKANASESEILQVQRAIHNAMAQQAKNPQESSRLFQEAEVIDRRISGGALGTTLKKTIATLAGKSEMQAAAKPAARAPRGGAAPQGAPRRP